MDIQPWLARIKRMPRLTRFPLAVEIALALVLKLALLALIWHAFFSAPQTRKMRMLTPQVEQHFLTPPQPRTMSGVRPESPSPDRSAHDSNR